jgi:signal transduction histidine kinase
MAVLALNRRQLIILSVILPLVAFILSLILLRVLQRVETLQREIIANVSHELRSPLALITGYTEMVRDITGKDEHLRNEDLNLILREAKRLSLMVDDIMDYSQLQSGCSVLHSASVNLYEIVAAEVEYSKKAATVYTVTVELLSFSEHITVNADGLKMSQVLRNLLNNAINHTADNTSITVAITKTENTVKVSVANPGIPIPKEERSSLWERYSHVQHQAGRREGTGIGLAIVSTILKAHGFKYGVVSERGFNTFWFAVEL